MYRVVLFDQRGCGKSRPRHELRDNTTQRLCEDIEKVREHLQIPKWHMVFGGSWGSTLGLFYAQAHPDRVGCLVLRGVFTARRAEFEAMSTAANFFPEVFDRFLEFLPENERHDPGSSYYKRLTSDNAETVSAAAREWNIRDMSIGALWPDPEAFAQIEDPDYSLTHALFEAHYAINSFWLAEGQLLAAENIEKMKDVPGESISLLTLELLLLKAGQQELSFRDAMIS